MKKREQDIIKSLRETGHSKDGMEQNRTDLVGDEALESVQQKSRIKIMSPVEYLEYLATKEEFSPSAIASASQSITTEPSLDPSATTSYSSSEPELIKMPKPQKQSLSNASLSQSTTYSLPLSPLDEMKNQFADLQTTPSSQFSWTTTEMSDAHSSVSSRFPQHQHPHQHVDNERRQQTDKTKSPAPYTGEPEISNDIGSISNKDDISISTSSPIIPPGLLLNKNRSRHSTPKLESVPSIQVGYTAQIQRSDSPLRQEFIGSEVGSQSNSSNYEFRLDYDIIPGTGESNENSSSQYYTSNSSIKPAVLTSAFRPIGSNDNSVKLNSQQNAYSIYNSEQSTSTTIQKLPQNYPGNPLTPYTYIDRPQQFFPQQPKNDLMSVVSDSVTRESIYQTEFRLASGDPDDPLLNNGSEENDGAYEVTLGSVNNEGTNSNNVQKDRDIGIVKIDVENEEGYENLGEHSMDNTRAVKGKLDLKITKEITSRGVQIQTHHNIDVESKQEVIAQGTNASQTVQQQDDAISPVSLFTSSVSGKPFISSKGSLENKEERKPKQGTWLFAGVIGVAIIILILFLISIFSSNSGPFNFISGKDIITIRPPSSTASLPHLD
ncbi:17228_t:CDS:2 [Acaulospora morrowiae]|uniref:17228_t:CDS:1 n=1 Tax=Acaulospora morrowiae TaxID=94023 RepID=A0A9N9AU98_9GLOM|nr:17228_t:CDS:2 [Acaulospora morrowiae]